MFRSFLILVIVAILRVLAWLKLSTWSWLEKVIPYLDWSVIGAAILFAAFALATLIGTFARNIGNKSTNREPRR